MEHFKRSLYRWYNIYKRDLPWRETNNPYNIWLSEVILQQTRVQQGTTYYLRFREQFPTVYDLANAPEDQVLKLWQGLGYYSRARNLHKTAKLISDKYNGNFPSRYSDIIQLKGIGPYTAAAIASIAFSLPYPAIDGNVYRVLSRYFGIETPIDSTQGKKQFQHIAEELISAENPGMHNQALMEFGALQCVPKSPNCNNCPLAQSCFAFQNNKVTMLPVKTKKTKQRSRYFYYYLLEQGDSIYMEKRTQNDIWQNLYQLPLVEQPRKLSDEELIKSEVPFIMEFKFNLHSISKEKKHVLSHQVIHARLVRIEISNDVKIRKPLFKVKTKDISKFAVPRLLELFFEDLKID